jgi:hypothetical protein
MISIQSVNLTRRIARKWFGQCCFAPCGLTLTLGRDLKAKDVAQIERMTGCRLPSVYKSLLLAPPAEIAEASELYPSRSCPILVDLDALVSLNTIVRQDGYSFENSSSERCDWPVDFIIIGATIGGDFYVIDSASGKAPVYFWDHEEGEFSKLSTTFAKFVSRKANAK